MRTLSRLRERVAAMSTCREVGRALQTYLDHELDGAGAAAVSAHLDHCVRCGMQAGTYARIKEALAHASEHGAVLAEDRLAIERLRRFAGTLSGSPAGGTGGTGSSPSP